MRSKINIWPYIELATVLKNKQRKGFGNMFRHQIETFGILVEFGYTNPLLLKASLIHDLYEDGSEVGFTSFKDVLDIDEDGKEVYKLVHEVSRKTINGKEEPKEDFLKRIMTSGSNNARILKLADRLSNVNSLTSTKNKDFINRYTKETEDSILPFAQEIDTKMAKELVETLHKLEFRK